MLLAAIAVVYLLSVGPVSPSSRVLTVCEVLADDPSKRNGQVVTVRGLYGGTDEGVWLSGECKTHLVTKGLSWGNDLSVYVDLSDERIARSWGRMFDTLRQLHADPRHDRIWVTFVGRIETKPSMDDEVVQMPYGLAKAGFGHMGDSPAEINVLGIKDVTVEGRQSGARRSAEKSGK
jgi:hypothetical protein